MEQSSKAPRGPSIIRRYAPPRSSAQDYWCSGYEGGGGPWRPAVSCRFTAAADSAGFVAFLRFDDWKRRQKREREIKAERDGHEIL